MPTTPTPNRIPNKTAVDSWINRLKWLMWSKPDGLELQIKEGELEVLVAGKSVHKSIRLGKSAYRAPSSRF